MPSSNLETWQHDGAWLGYLINHPDFWSQGHTQDELHEHLRDINNGLPSDVREVGRSDIFVKRLDVITEIVSLGAVLVRKGKRHDWFRNPANGARQPVPLHREIAEPLARHIIRALIIH